MAMISHDWTVIGLWYGDRAYAVGAVAGRHDVLGGLNPVSDQGLWATYVTNDGDANDACIKAQALMEAEEG